MKKKKIEAKLKRFIEERFVVEPEKAVRLGVWALGTVACHNLNINGFFNWFGKVNETIPTGWPPPFHERRRFPWESQASATLEDKITEWALPALTAWVLVYHPMALAKFVDAMIPF